MESLLQEGSQTRMYLLNHTLMMGTMKKHVIFEKEIGKGGLLLE